MSETAPGDGPGAGGATVAPPAARPARGPAAAVASGWSGRRYAALGLLAAAILAPLLAYAFVVPQTPGRLERASAALLGELGLWTWLAGWVPAPDDPVAVAALFAAAAAVSCGAYRLALLVVWRRPAGRRELAAAIAVSGVLLAPAALALPTANTDVFDYVTFGRVWAVHGENPYETPPAAFSGDPVLPYASPRYTSRPDNKLPAWMLVNTGLARVAGDDPVTSLLVYRSALGAVSLANVLLIALILARTRPDLVLAGVVGFGWNPVVAVFGPSKTDTVMVCFLLLAALAVLSERRTLAAVGFALSAFVKLVTLPLAAVAWIREIARRRFLPALLAAAAFAATVALVYVPFGGLDLFASHLESRRVTETAAGALGGASGWTAWLVEALLAAVVVVAGLTRDASFAGIARRWLLVALVVTAFYARPGLPWYLLTLVAVASVASAGWVWPVVVAVSGAYLLTGTWRSTSAGAFDLPDVLSGTTDALYLGLAVLAALTVAVLFWRRRGRRAREPAQPREPAQGQD